MTYKILLAFGTKIVTILILEYIIMNDVMNTFVAMAKKMKPFLTFLITLHASVMLCWKEVLLLLQVFHRAL